MPAVQLGRPTDPILLQALTHTVRRFPDVTDWTVPGADQLSEIEALVAAGVEPSRIKVMSSAPAVQVLMHALYGCALDVDPGHKDLWDVLPQANQIETAASYALFCHLVQLRGRKSEVMRWQRIEVESNISRHWEAVHQSVQSIAAKLTGVQSVALDYRPPNSPTQGVLWTPAAGRRLVKVSHKGDYILSAVQNLKGLSWLGQPPSAWHLWLAREPERLKKDVHWPSAFTWQLPDYSYFYLLSNRPVPEVGIPGTTRKSLSRFHEQVYPIFDDSTITVDSQIEFVRCTQKMAMYYYDLFVKNLGMPSAEDFSLLTIDGKVAGVVGFFLSDWRQKRYPIFADVFSITIPERRYKLGRLLTYLLTLRETAEMVCRWNPGATLPVKMTHFQTTFLSKSPSVMKARGILKLRDRTQLADGSYKLVYVTTLKTLTKKQVVAEWLKKQDKE